MFGIYLLLSFFILGTIFGSFLNVIILRHNTGISKENRSYCFSCGHKLLWYELVPVVSFFIQNGKCNSCKSRISWQYPIVEVITGLVFLSLFWKVFFVGGLNIRYELFGKDLIYSILSFAYYALIFSILIIISVYDFYHKIIPNFFVYLFSVVAFSGIFLFNVDEIRLNMIFSGFILFSFFAIMWFISKGRWMGFGDAKLALGIGFLLGIAGGITAIIISFWMGALIGILLLVVGRLFRLYLGGKYLTLKSEIPFGPFMALATFITFMFNLNLNNISGLFS